MLRITDLYQYKTIYIHVHYQHLPLAKTLFRKAYFTLFQHIFWLQRLVPFVIDVIPTLCRLVKSIVLGEKKKRLGGFCCVSLAVSYCPHTADPSMHPPTHPPTTHPTHLPPAHKPTDLFIHPPSHPVV